MVIMLDLNQAALLSIQLYVMCQVSAVTEIFAVEHRLVNQGDSVTFTCNISKKNPMQISWTKDRCVFSYSASLNLTFSNFTSHRLRVDMNLPSTLSISNIQYDDAGLYRCNFFDVSRMSITEWNLAVSREPGDVSPLWFVLYILTAVIGFLLCVFTLAVCLYRKLRTRTPNQSPVQDQFQLQSEGEESLSQPQGGTNNKRRSQYMERLNSIYGV